VTLQSAGARGWDEVADLGPWFHNLHLPGGLQTAPDHPLGDFPAFKWQQIGAALPTDLTGQRVLDIGCNAGFYTFELAKRGAIVLGIDHDEHYLRQARWAAQRLGVDEQVEFRQMGVYDLGDLDETFDIVLFLGVLYHLRYPLLGLDLVAEKVRGTLVLQTLTMPLGSHDGLTPPDLPMDARDALRQIDWPAMAFVEHHLAGDHTNWWAPSAGAVEAMVRTTGLRVVERPGHEIWLCERERASFHLDELHQASRRQPPPRPRSLLAAEESD
jgi:tRNA (mo5U34)-methyltransferase